MKAFDPIIYEEVEIEEWLNAEPDNIILVFFQDNLDVISKSNYICFALKKSFIFATALNELYIECNIKVPPFHQKKHIITKQPLKDAERPSRPHSERRQARTRRGRRCAVCKNAHCVVCKNARTAQMKSE